MSDSDESGWSDASQPRWDDGRQPGAYVMAPEEDTESEEFVINTRNPAAHSTVNESVHSPWELSETATRQPILATGTPDFNKSTRAAHAFNQSNPIYDGAMANIAYLMKPGSWPHEGFKEADKHGEKRASWVEWASNFAHALVMMGIADDRHKAGLLRFKGGKDIWRILGEKATNMGFTEMWERVDRYYASLSDPAVDAAEYRKMHQKGGETLLEFIDRLNRQAKLAEFSEEEEYRELRLALLDRSMNADEFRLQTKLNPLMTNSDLISLGSFLRKEQKHHADNPMVMEVTSTDKRKREGQEDQQPSKFMKTARERQGYKTDHSDPVRECKSCRKKHTGRCTAPTSDKVCYTCGKTGHLSYDCTTNNSKLSGKTGRTCYDCGSPDHLAAKCPNKINRIANNRQIHQVTKTDADGE